MPDLYLTPTRAGLLQDIRDGHLYFEANEWWNNVNGRKQTAAIDRVAGAGWVTWKQVDEETKLPGELAGRVYARLKSAGRSVLEEWEKSR